MSFAIATTAGESLADASIGADDGDGAFAFSVLENVNAVVSVSATGAWTLAVEHMTPPASPPPTRTFKGRGQNVTPFFKLGAGPLVVRFENAGSALFTADLLDADGGLVAIVPTQSGLHNGRETVEIDQAGAYVWSVIAVGDWSLSFEP